MLPKRGAFSFFDYSQIEPRFFAYYAAKSLKDFTIAEWYREGRDVYRELAGQVYGRPGDTITEDERQLAKVWFLMSLYGAGPKKLGEEIGMPLAEAKEFYKAFHAGLPQIKGLSNPPPKSPRIPWEPGAIERIYRKRGYLRTPYGRHLHAEKYGEHKLLNKLIQGSAADLMKAALLRVGRYLRANPEIESRMVLTIHDEIGLDGPEHELPRLHVEIPPLMGEAWFEEVVPIKVEHEVATTNWAEKVGYDEWAASLQEVAA